MDENIMIFTGLMLFFGFLIKWIFFPKKKFQAFDEKWKKTLQDKVAFYQKLSDSEKPRFEAAVLQFFNDVDITGIEIEIDETDRLLVAASAVIPLFGFPKWRYRNINEVLLYQGSFDQDYKTKGSDRNVLGMVGSGAMNRMMILSKPALHQGFRTPMGKSNVGIHEFVHLLDMADGAVDGLPQVLMEQQYVLPWLHEMHEGIRDIKKRDSNINPYGATNEAEFLSVAAEYFFNQPEHFEKKHPELFDLMEKIFRQDLA